MSQALKIAFSGGAVMGLCVVGLGIIGITLAYFVFDRNIDIVTGFGLGASSIALFARVGGGIYTKAADVGADLVGKVEAGIPEDDPRNPATIADNVGDNVGDVAGMGADLFESYVGAIISALTLGAVVFTKGEGVEFVFVLSVCGIIASVVGIIFARNSKSENPQSALNSGTYLGGILVVCSAAYFSNSIFGNYGAFLAIISGLIAGTAIGKITEIYTSSDYASVKRIADGTETGHATTIIAGLAVGMYSTFWPMLFIAMFVELENGVEGLVHISSLTDDYYEFVEEQYYLIGEHLKKVYRLGDKVKIEVLQVSIADRAVDFILAGATVAARTHLKAQIDYRRENVESKRKGGAYFSTEKKPGKAVGKGKHKKENRRDSRKGKSKKGR